MNALAIPFLQTYAGMSVLVTGGAGFIGSHITERLVNVGAQVTVLDNLSSGSLDNLKAVREQITFIHGDITDLSTCIQATTGIQTVFHLAALVSVPVSVENPLTCHAINVTGTFNILEAARINKTNKVIFSSSSAVYGAKEGVCREEDTCSPLSPYGTAKLIGEEYCRIYARTFGIRTLCLRYFNVFGPRQNPTGPYAGVLAQWNQAMALNNPITIYGDGLQSRDFIPVEQVAMANLTLALLPDELLDGRPVNIATGTSMTLLDLVAQLKKEHPGYTAELCFQPARPGDIKHSGALCERYHAYLQKAPPANTL